MSSGRERAKGGRLSAAERRQRILAAAVQVFAENGYADASMAEIASRAGVVASVLYDHFGSKRELCIELLEQHGEALIERSIQPQADLPPERIFRASIEAFCRSVEEDPFVWRLLFRDPPADPEIAAAYNRVYSRATEATVALMRSAAPDRKSLFGIPAERAGPMLARASQSAIEGFAKWWWEHPQVPRAEVADLLSGLLWSGLGSLLDESTQQPQGDENGTGRSEHPGIE